MDVTFVVPGRLDQPTGGYAYDRRVIADLRARGCAVDVLDVGDGFPHPDAATKLNAMDLLAAVPAGRPVVIDGLALGVLPEAAAALRAEHKVIALVHHPLALEAGLSAAQAEALRHSERAALAAAHHVIVTSAATGRAVVADYGVAAAAVTVAPPGHDPVAPHERRAGATPALLAVGAVVRRKGYDVLIAALDRVRYLDWQLTIVGDCSRDPAVVLDLTAELIQRRLGERIRLAGAVAETELAALYRDADVFVLASRHEGYGMAYAAAIGHGLPVIGTRVGAVPETVPAEAGLLVPPDDPAALAAALRTLLTDADLRRRCAAAARAARLPTWDTTVDAFAQVLGALP